MDITRISIVLEKALDAWKNRLEIKNKETGYRLFWQSLNEETRIQEQITQLAPRRMRTDRFVIPRAALLRRLKLQQYCTAKLARQLGCTHLLERRQ